MPWFLDGEPLLDTDIPVVRGEGSVTVSGRGEAVGRWVGSELHIAYRGEIWVLTDCPPRRAGLASEKSGDLLAPMPGAIVEVAVAVGDKVKAGQRLAVLEAMKTQQPLLAPFAGEVTKVEVRVGDQVTEGKLLVQVAAHDEG